MRATVTAVLLFLQPFIVNSAHQEEEKLAQREGVHSLTSTNLPQIRSLPVGHAHCYDFQVKELEKDVIIHVQNECGGILIRPFYYFNAENITYGTYLFIRDQSSRPADRSVRHA